MAVVNSDVQDRIELCGLTQKEASQYLRDRGHAASVGAIAAWGKGHYKPTPAVLDDLDFLYAVIVQTDADKDDQGVALPEGALRRRAQVRKIKPVDFTRLQALTRSLGEAEPPRDDD